jgi:AGCS family alanine or glycine:cation symporter
MLILVGGWLTVESGFIQIRKLPAVIKNFAALIRVREKDVNGVHPLKAFFACIGGCVGVGNIVSICSAVQIGGPGALFWIWITAILGMMVKYAEVYLGVRFRVKNQLGGYNGGPMYFLQKVFTSAWIPQLVCILLCLYGVEVYQFSVITTSISSNLGISQYFVVGLLLFLVIFAGSGGVRRVGNISSAIIPLFVAIYVSMSAWVLLNNLSVLPHVLHDVFAFAFTGHAAAGGFLGSTLMMTISQGVRRGCYTGDLGVGYASVIHSESSVQVPEKQASLAIFDIFLDTFIICTSSLLVILATDVWRLPVETGLLVQTALGKYFPYMDLFMPFFLFLLGYSTINAYFCVGLKCAEHLLPKYGRFFYYAYAAVALLTFSFIDTTRAQSVMAVVGGLLLILNCIGIYYLKKELSYNFDDQERVQAQAAKAQI